MKIVPERYYDNTTGVMLTYYLDVDGIWYSLDSVSDKLGYSSHAKDEIKNILNNLYTREYEEEYEDLRGNKRIGKFLYINSIMLFELLDRNEKHIRKIRNTVIFLERQLGLINNEDDNDHTLKINLNLFNNELESEECNIDSLKDLGKAIYNSPSIQEIINTPEDYSSNKIEKDVIKEYICNAIDNDALESFEIDESKMTYTIDYETLQYDLTCYDYLDENELEEQIITKKESTNSTVRYKKNRNVKVEDICPYWLKELVK